MFTQQVLSNVLHTNYKFTPYTEFSTVDKPLASFTSILCIYSIVQ